jgi:hypothetical protein
LQPAKVIVTNEATACMRMRKLGKGQSVVFCVPPEIQSKILARNVDSGDIGISHILNWAVSETCTDMRRSMPLWAAQGQRFENQNSLWNEARASGEMHMSKDQAELFLEDDAQSLEDRYRPRSAADDTSVEQISLAPNLNLIMERCREFGDLNFNSATLYEEQERELSPEIKQERQVQRPPPVNPAAHHVHRDLMTFVSTGTLISGSPAYKPAFETLHDTSAAAHLDVLQFGDGLLVTADFANTVQAVSTSDISDVNQRSAQWILTSTMDNSSSNNIVKHMMIISPHEAGAGASTRHREIRLRGAARIRGAAEPGCCNPHDDPVDHAAMPSPGTQKEGLARPHPLST